jgi:WD40 repeat protein
LLASNLVGLTPRRSPEIIMQVLQAKGVKDFVSVVAFAPDGSRLIAGSGDGYVRVWDLASSQILYTIDRRPAGDHRAVTLSPDGRTLITGDTAGIRLWDAGVGTPIRTLTIDRGSPDAVTVRPEGQEVITAGDPHAGPGFLRWDLATGTELPRWVMPSPIFIARVAFSPDGRRIGGHAGAGVTVWDMATREEVFTAPEAAPTLGTAALAWSPDGRLLASGCGNALIVWDIGERREVARLKQSRKHFQFAAFSPDGATIVAVSNEATAKLWDTATWKLRQEYAWGVGSLKCVAFAPDGLRAAAGGDKGQAIVWDI